MEVEEIDRWSAIDFVERRMKEKEKENEKLSKAAFDNMFDKYAAELLKVREVLRDRSVSTAIKYCILGTHIDTFRDRCHELLGMYDGHTWAEVFEDFREWVNEVSSEVNDQ